MDTKNILKVATIGLAAAMAMQASAERVAPTYITPMVDSELSAPSSLDSPSAALNVSVDSIYVPITPCRLVDTRRFWPSGAPAPISSPFGGLWPLGETLGFWAWNDQPGDNYLAYGGYDGRCGGNGIPREATAVHVNFTIVSPQGDGYLRAWANGANEPLATMFAWDAGFGVSNAGTVPICSDGTTGGDFETQCASPDPQKPGVTDDFMVKIYSQQPEQLVIDAFGYYKPAN